MAFLAPEMPFLELIWAGFKNALNCYRPTIVRDWSSLHSDFSRWRHFFYLLLSFTPYQSHKKEQSDMSDKTFNFWQKWLTYANIMAIGVGLLAAFAGNSIFFDVHNAYTKEVFFDSAEFSPDVLKLKNWLFGIIGGTIVGYHILMIMISENSFKKKEPWAYKALWFGLLSWFFIDSGISIYYGAIHNVVIINLVALVLIGIPLVVVRKEFKKTATSDNSV